MIQSAEYSALPPPPYFGPWGGSDDPPSRESQLFDVGAERLLLSSLLIDTSQVPAVSAFLGPFDFYREEHQTIFEIMVRLYEQQIPVEPVFLYDEAQRLGKVIHPAYLAELAAEAATGLYAVHYATLVERYAVRRSLVSLSGAIGEIAYDAALRSKDELYAAVDGSVYERLQRRAANDTAGIADIMGSYVELLDQRRQGNIPLGLPCCWQGLTDYLVAFQRTDLVVVGARPSIGKTTWMLGLAYRSARYYQIPSLIFSLEMSRTQLVEKLLAMDSGIDSTRLRAGAIQPYEWPVILESAERLSTLPIFINDRRLQTISTVRSQALHVARQVPLGYVMLDNLQIMSAERTGNRHQEISAIARGFADLANVTNTVGIALSQINREALARQDKRPTLGDFRESGSIEAEAAVALGLHREDYYDPLTTTPNIMENIVLKHRHGSVGTARLYFNKSTGNLLDLGTMDEQAAPPPASNVLIY